MSDDRAAVRALLGREPRGDFEVVVRDATGAPVVIRNAPLLDDGTPMPTRYWLVGRDESIAVGRLEADGGVDRAEREVGLAAIAEAHDRYRAERDAALPPGHLGPAPTAGVGGTRVGVKCLHAHYAWHLAGGDDPVGRWVAERISPTPASARAAAVAVVELGSNSVKLLATGTGGDLVQMTRVTRLGAGVDRTGALDPDAMARTLAAIVEFHHALGGLDIRATRVVATSACRDAANRESFFDAVADVIGARPELLSGSDEGRFAYRGARAALPDLPGPVLVIDIGGGSTEFMIGDDDVEAVLSIDVGAGRITERELHSDPPHPAELSNAIGYVSDHVDDVVRDLPAVAGAATIIGVGGTVKVMAAVELGLPQYDPAAVHGFEFSRDAVEDVFRTLATESLAERVHNPGLPRDRAEVIVGGSCVLVAILRRLHAPGIVVSSRGVLDGVASELLERLG